MVFRGYVKGKSLNNISGKSKETTQNPTAKLVQSEGAVLITGRDGDVLMHLLAWAQTSMLTYFSMKNLLLCNEN